MEAGLAVPEGIEPHPQLAGHHSWYALLGELHRRAGHNPKARRYRSKGAHFTAYERGAGAGSAAACFS
jgi:predicted RNA polymerase sigma factor